MQLVVNEQQQIIAYSVLGNIAGSVDYDGTVPDDFAINFVPNLYLLKSNTIVTNPDYVAPIASPERPTAEQKQLAELIKSNAQQMTLNAQLIKQVAALQTAQAEQAAQTQTTQEAE